MAFMRSKLKPKQLVVALSLVAGSFAAFATPQAQEHFHFSALNGSMASGTVEQVEEFPQPSRFDTFAELFEHAVRPQPAERLLIRLDDGSTITLEQDGTRRFAAGQRVRVFAHVNGRSVAPE